MTRWYALDQQGDMVFVGEFESFGEADRSMDYSLVWLVDEDAAHQWLVQLKEMLE